MEMGHWRSCCSFTSSSHVFRPGLGFGLWRQLAGLLDSAWLRQGAVIGHW
jgi:hypothetical protein